MLRKAIALDVNWYCTHNLGENFVSESWIEIMDMVKYMHLKLKIPNQFTNMLYNFIYNFTWF